MNEQYLRGYFESYVLPNKPDADFNDWVSKISNNDAYKQGMFNTYVKPVKQDADYADWNNKIFGAQAPQEERSFLGAIPVVGEGIHYGGKMVESFVEHTIPQMYQNLKTNWYSGGLEETRKLQEQLAADPTKTKALLAKAEAAGIHVRNTGESYESALQRIADTQLNDAVTAEEAAAKYKEQAAVKLKGSIQNLTDVKSVSDFANWLGTSVGQLGSQIPLSVASLGTSSFLMESATVYDEQLDLLAEKTGLSRKEIIERGLDDDAAGQAYAILAGALDAVSAGSILGLFKKAATKEITKKSIKDVLLDIGKSTAGEFLTEGTQGQLEGLGASVGADTEFNWDWKRFFNEGSAGAVGGGVFSVAGVAAEKTDRDVQKALDDAAALAAKGIIGEGESTGSETLDAELAAIERDITNAVTDIQSQVDAYAGQKIQDELRKAQEFARNAESRAADALAENELLKMRNEWESSPTIPVGQVNVPGNRLAFEAARDEEALLNDPSAENLIQRPSISEEEAQWGDDSAAQVASLKEDEITRVKQKAAEGKKLTKKEQELISPIFNNKDTTVPKYDPKTLDEVGTQPAKSFTYSDGLGGTASGKIVNGVAVIDTIYAATDKQGAPIKGTNLYGKVISELAKAGATQLRVGMQSQGSKAALTNAVNNGLISIKENGGKDLDGNPIDFTITKQPVTVEKSIKQPTQQSKTSATKGNLSSPVFYQGIPKTTAYMQALLDENGVPLIEGSVADVEKFKLDNGIPQDKVKLVDLDTANPDSLINKFLNKGKLHAKIIKEPVPALKPKEKQKVSPKEKLVAPKIKKVITKSQEELEDDYEYKIGKVEDRLPKISKRAPSEQISTLDKLVAEADENYTITKYEGYKQLRDKLNKRLTELQTAKETKEEGVQLKKEKADKKKEESLIPAKVESKKESKLKTQKVNVGKHTVTADVAKEYFYKKIAYTVAKHASADALKLGPEAYGSQKDVSDIVDAYIQFRKDNGLPIDTKQGKVDKEFILSKVKDRVQFYKNRINKFGGNITLKEIENGLESKSEAIKEITESARGKSAAQIKEERDAREKAKRDFEAEFGGEFDSTSFITLEGAKDNAVLDYLEQNKLYEKPRKEITFDEYVALAPKSQGPILRALHRVVSKYKERRGGKTKYVTVTVEDTNVPFLGFNTTTPMATHSTIVILVDKNGKPIGQSQRRNTVLHEYLHDYTNLMFVSAYNQDKSFASMINKTFEIVKQEVMKQTNALLYKKASVGIEGLTPYEQRLWYVLKKYTGYGSGILSTVTDNKKTVLTIDTITDQLFETESFYAFSDPREFLSEVFSDPDTIALLSQFKMDEKIQSGPFKGEKKSLLYRWFEDLLDWVKEQIKITPVENNAIDYALSKIAAYDAEFSNEVLEHQSPQYQSISTAEMAAKAKKPLSGKRATTKIRDLFIRKLELMKSIKSENDVRKFISKINSRLQNNQQISEDLYAPAIWKEIEKRRATLSADTKRAKIALDWMKDQPQYKQDDKFAYDVDNFEKVDLNKLNATQRHHFINNGLVPLAYNNMSMPKSVYNIVLKSVSDYNKAELLKLKGKLNTKAFTRLLARATNIMTTSSGIAKMKTTVADKFVKIIHRDFLWAATKAGVEANNFNKKLSKLADDHKLTHQNLAKIGMYGRIFSTKVNQVNKAAWEKEVQDAAEFVYESALAKQVAYDDKVYTGSLTKEQIEKEVVIAKELLEKLKKNPDMRNILTTGEQVIYNEIRAFADTHEASFFRNAQAIWGNVPPVLSSYFPSLAQGKSSVTSMEDLKRDPIIRSGADNLYDALVDTTEYAAIHGRKVWSTYDRTQNPKGYYYEYDALAIGKRWSKTMLFDIYASTPLKLSNMLMSSQEAKTALNSQIAVNAVVNQIRTAAGAGLIYDPNVGKMTREFMKFRDSIYMAGIVTTGQFVLQLSSGIAASAVIAANINPLKAAAIMAKATAAASLSTFNENSELNKWLEKNGLGIQLRDVGFEKYLSPDDFKSYSSRIYKKIGVKAENASDFAIRSGDKLAARMVWFAAYFDAGGTLENPNKEAVLRAERLVGTLQNMSDARWSAPMFKSNNVYKKILMGMIYAYKSFSLNAWLGMVSGLRNFNNKEARTIAAAQFGSYLAFHAASVYLTRPMWAAVGNWVANNFDGGDDEDDDDEKKSKASEFVTNVAWDMLAGAYLPSVLDQLARWGVVQSGLAQKIWGEPDEEFNVYQDSPFYAPADIEKVLASSYGPGVKEAVTIPADIAQALFIQIAANMAGESVYDEDHYFEWSQHWFNAASDAMGAWALIPFRGDIRRIFKGVVKERKARQRKLNELYGGNGGGFGTEIDNSDQIDYSGEYIDMTDINAWTNNTIDEQ